MAGYIGNIPVPQGTQTRQNFTATASQTSFPTIGYTAGFIDVYLNGVKLINGTDFTATNGSDVVLTTAASASDVLDVVIFDTFTSSNGTFNDATLKNNVTLKNDTEEDSDGGRASKIIYQGEQSGGEISTLAEIQASHYGTSDDQKGTLIFRTNDGSDGTSPTEAARIDSDRNFLVGQIAQATNVTGFSARANSLSHFCRDTSSTGSGVLLLNKKTGSGDVLVIQKDDSTIGKLGVASGGGSDGLYIGDGDVGLELDDANNAIYPYNTTTLSSSDDVIDLGDSNKRFKDLYLSGGIYLGGTGSANYLTDYEEGTFTPVLADATSGGNTSTVGVVVGRYTKVGQIVHVNIITANINTSGLTSGNPVYVQGLPFAGATVTGISQHLGGVRTDSINVASGCFGINFLIGSGQAYGAFYENNDNSGDTIITWADVQSSPNGDLFVTGTYEI